MTTTITVMTHEEVCGGHIPLGPDATNRCEKCGAFVFPGIHPAKKPMEGGFSLDKFLSGITKEDAEALGEMFDAMEAEKRLNGWIPCAERLPEPDQEVLIYLDSKSTGEIRGGSTPFTGTTNKDAASRGRV